MADDIIQVAPDGTGKKVDNSSLTVGSNTVYRQRMNIADPTNASSIAAVKAASTAPVATDPALVVAASPNSVQQVSSAQGVTTTGTITSSSSVVGPINVANMDMVTVGVYGTNYSGVTFLFQVSIDNSNWFTVQGSRVDTGQVSNGMVLGSNINAAWDMPVGAWIYFRVQATAFASGSANVILTAQSLPYDPAPSAVCQGFTPSGSALPTSPIVAPVIIGGGSVAGGTNATAATVKAASTAAASTDTALVVGIHPTSNTIAVTNAAATAKGTQPTYGLPTQDLKDSGRTAVVISVSGVASVTTSALVANLNIYKAGTVTTTSSSYTVTTGKTFRLQTIQFGCRFATPSTTTTFASTTFALRFVVSGGTLAATSSILLQDSKLCSSSAATPNSDLTVPDGLELPSGYVIGVTHVASATTLLEDFIIVGYEY